MNKQINRGPKEEIKGRWGRGGGRKGRKGGVKFKLNLAKIKSMVNNSLLVLLLSNCDYWHEVAPTSVPMYI